MGRIVISENVTLDGVIQDPTVEGGFEFGGWFDQMPDEVREEWANVESQDALDSQAWQIGRGSYLWIAERWAPPRAWPDRSPAPHLPSTNAPASNPPTP